MIILIDVVYLEGNKLGNAKNWITLSHGNHLWNDNNIFPSSWVLDLKKLNNQSMQLPGLPVTGLKTGRQICLNVDNRLNPCQDHYLIRSMQIVLRYKINLFVKLISIVVYRYFSTSWSHRCSTWKLTNARVGSMEFLLLKNRISLIHS